MTRTSLLSRSTSSWLIAALILVAIAAGPHALHAAAGVPDMGFGTDGKVRTDFLGHSTDWAFGVTTQDDGKIIAVGTALSTGEQFAVARYLRNGALDPTFGDGGKVLTSFRGADIATAVAVQPNGKIVVAGTSYTIDPAAPTGFAVARYNRDGSLDLTFGDGGKVLTGFPDAFTVARAMTIEPNGKIVVVGQATDAEGRFAHIAVARYTKHGALDPAFGGGTVTASIEDIDDARAVAVDRDGRIVVAGSTYNMTSFNSDIAVLRLDRDGSLDATFGSGGIVQTDATGWQDAASSVMVQPDGRIVVAGWAYGDPFPGGADVVLARYDQNGSPDPTFGTAGIAVADLGSWDQAVAAVLLPDGRILVGTSSGNFTVSRYNANGSLDVSFGTGGIAQAGFTTPDLDTFDSMTALAIQPNGKIVVAGFMYPSFATGDADFALLRFDGRASASR